LTEYKPQLVEMSEALLQRETLDAEQVRRIVAGETLDEIGASAPSATPAPPRESKPKERPGTAIVPPLSPRPVTQE